MKIARLRLAELLDVQRLGLSQKLSGVDDVGLDFLWRGSERVGFTLPEVVDQANELFGLKFCGYLTTPRRPPARQRTAFSA
jgi:hypothetical protein